MSSTAALAPAASRAALANCARPPRPVGSQPGARPRLRRGVALGSARVPAPRRVSPRAVSPAGEDSCVSDLNGDENLSVTVDGASDPAFTVISIRATNRPGILQLLKSTLEDLGLSVERTEVDMEKDLTSDVFYVTGDDGERVDDPYDLANIEQVLKVVLNAHYSKSSGAPRPPDGAKSASGPDGMKPRQKDLLYSLMDNYIKNDVLSVQSSIVNHVEYTLGRSRYRFDDFEAYQVRFDLPPYAVRRQTRVTDGRAIRWKVFSRRNGFFFRYIKSDAFSDSDARALTFPLVASFVAKPNNPHTGHVAFRARPLDRELERHAAVLPRAGPEARVLFVHGVPHGPLVDQLAVQPGGEGHVLGGLKAARVLAGGSGGEGARRRARQRRIRRLAACFLDSMASENLPAWGYGIRYQYGMFRQEMHDGFQHENPDYWLNFGNPWEIERPNIAYPIKFYGHVSTVDVDNHQVFKWDSGEEVTAVAYDTPIPGWNTPNTINLRLWSAKPSREFDLESFNTGDYVQAILAKQRAETISAVLYPDDRTYQGKELRLKQQFFMVSATLQDIIRRFLVTHDASFDAFPEKVALQLNDTHPTIGVPELMRLLMDEHGLGWTKRGTSRRAFFPSRTTPFFPKRLRSGPWTWWRTCYRGTCRSSTTSTGGSRRS
jgi:hypothetical protein